MKIYDILKSAEELYIKEISKRSDIAYPGMCWCLKVTIHNVTGKKVSDYDLITNIPEFNPKFLKATKSILVPGLEFWWDNGDTKSRLNAFKVLKNIYKESIREFDSKV